jgi:hypothetical protein
MMEVPDFIRRSSVEGTTLQFEFGEKEYEAAEEYKSGNLKSVLRQMCGHANLAFALGTAEWTCRRLERLTDCRPVLDYVEAVWAAMIDPRYLARKRISDRVEYSWTDAAKDAATFVGNRLTLAYFDCKALDSDRFRDTIQLVAVARHVLPEKKQFEGWSKQVLNRLVALYPKDEGVGSPLPREVLEVDTEYDPEQRAFYLNRFLQRLSPSSNPFLADRESLSKTGTFRGMPYESIG